MGFFFSQHRLYWRRRLLLRLRQLTETGVRRVRFRNFSQMLHRKGLSSYTGWQFKGFLLYLADGVVISAKLMSDLVCCPKKEKKKERVNIWLLWGGPVTLSVTLLILQCQLMMLMWTFYLVFNLQDNSALLRHSLFGVYGKFGFLFVSIIIISILCHFWDSKGTMKP